MKKVYFIILLLLILSMTGCMEKEPKILIEDPIIDYKCPTGYDLVNDKCVYTTTLLASLRNTCPQGYYLNGTKCAKNGTILYISECGINKTYQNGSCYPTITPTMEYYCTSGKLVGTNCITEKYADPTTFYICNPGFHLNEDNQCQSNN